MSSARTIVFDLGGVLVPTSRVIPRLAEAVGVDEAAFSVSYWTARREYDLGGDPVAYWTSVVTGLGRDPEPALVAHLQDVDSHKWSTLPEESVALLDRLRGERIAVLSNAPAPLAAAVRAAPWSAAAERLLFSADIGLMKPDPAVYARADVELGTAPGRAVFFDDKAENVEAARAHGWAAHVWEGPAAALRALAAAA